MKHGLLVKFKGTEYFVVDPEAGIIEFPNVGSMEAMFGVVISRFKNPMKRFLATKMIEQMNPRSFSLETNVDMYIEDRTPVDIFTGAHGWTVNGLISELETTPIQVGDPQGSVKDLLRMLGVSEDDIFTETEKEIFNLILTKDGRHWAVCDGIGSVPVAYSIEELIERVSKAKSVLEGYQLRAIKLPPSVEEFDYYVTKDTSKQRPQPLYKGLHKIEMGDNVEELVVEDVTDRILGAE